MKISQVFLLLMVMSIISAKTVSENTTATCPQGWRDLSSVDNLGCVLFVKQQLTWDEAAAECWKQEESHLVSVATDYQREYLGQTLYLEDLAHHPWWVGATDRNREGRWTWSHDCGEVGEFGWRQAEPGGGIEENCAVQSGIECEWSDLDCNENMFGDLPIFAICQI